MGPRSSMDRHPSAGHVQLRTNEILSILRSYQGRIKGDDDDVPSNGAPEVLLCTCKARRACMYPPCAWLLPLH